MPFDRRTLLGAVAALGLVTALSAAMVPLRTDLSVASAGLVLVVPVVVGVALGGMVAGAIAVAAGFIAYDLLFIPPYGTLAVGAAQNWVALGVYAVVLFVVTAVVADQRRARAAAHRREQETRRLFELSEALVTDAPDLPDRIVDTVQRAFQPQWTALLVPNGEGGLSMAAGTGDLAALGDTTAVAGLAAAAVAGGSPVHMLDVPAATDAGNPVAAALVTDGMPVGILALAPAPSDAHDRRLLATFANQAALAMTRARLREQALRSEALEAAEHARQTLLRTVSHDLRTPLATVKASLSDLRRPDLGLAPTARAELLVLAEEQADRLDRLVANLLDMTRVESGTLVLDRRAVAVADLVDEALSTGGIDASTVDVDLDDDLPPVDGDHTLLSHALLNLVENALRHSPDEVRITGRPLGGVVELAVADRGPGVPVEQRAVVLALGGHVAPPAWSAGTEGSAASAAAATATRTGLGLAIAQAFVSAHAGTVTVGDNPGGGARFTVILPATTAHRLPEGEPPPTAGRGPDIDDLAPGGGNKESRRPPPLPAGSVPAPAARVAGTHVAGTHVAGTHVAG